jgi:YfiR/HmsC-like
MTRPGSNIPRLRAAFRRAAALTIVVIVTVVAGWAGGRPPLAAAATTSVAQREYLIKAAFVYDMLKATQWPKTRSGRVLLCVLGRDPFGAAWLSIAGRPIGKSKLEVAPVQAGGDLAACDALFLSTSERARWPDIRAALGTRPILTMSEMTGFAQDGGMVGLMAIDNRLRFDVNLKAVRKAGLSIDTNALEQANMVHAQAASVGLP